MLGAESTEQRAKSRVRREKKDKGNYLTWEAKLINQPQKQ